MGHIAHGPLYGLGELPLVAAGSDDVREADALRWEVTPGITAVRTLR